MQVSAARLQIDKHDSTLRAALIERSDDLNICHIRTTGPSFLKFPGYLFNFIWAKISNKICLG